MNRIAQLLLTLLFILFIPGAYSEEIKSTASDQSALSLTIYNAGRALVRDQRKLTIPAPVNSIAFMDVAEQIMPQTVAIGGVEVLEQNYDYDLLSPQALIEKNIGNTVRIARRSSDTGETLEWSEGSILSTNGGIVLKMKDGSLETINAKSHYQMVFDEVPDNLRTSPTLSLLLKTPVEGSHSIDMTYLTTGMSWQSDYILQLNDSETRASLDSWITLNNQSGIGYRNAKLQLLAGDVNVQPSRSGKLMRREAMALQAASMDDVSEQALHGYHLYTVPHKTTIKNRQSKQIKLFTATEIPVQKQLRDRAYVSAQSTVPQKSKPEQHLKFSNSEPSLGLPIPKGTVRVYAPDTEGNKQFIGEDAIGHTAVNDELEINLGKTFDISVERKTTRFQQLSKKQHHLTRKISINNGAKKAQPLTITEIMPSPNWLIKQASAPYIIKSPSEADFILTIRPMQKIEIVYDVLVTYP